MLKAIDHTAKFRDEIINVFEFISRDTPSLYKFLYEACNRYSVFLIGGFLRSVANAENPRDIDVIFALSDHQLSSYIAEKNLPTFKNKFGGYKIDFNSVTLDVWASENNWAFMDKVVAIGSRDIIFGVANGTFLNYDSLVFDLRTQKINVTAYNECVRSKTLDIIRKNDLYANRNPGKIGNVIRAFRIRQKTGLFFSPTLCRYIYEQFVAIGLNDVNKAADYLMHIISAKNSDKNRSLQNKNILKDHIDYVIGILEMQREKKTSQLELFDKI